MNLESYKGREQAYIKHTLLRSYLERLFMILGQHHKTICYVDCFAGPWKEGGNNLSDTSIAISLDIMEKCRKGLFLKSKRDVKFRALFIEKNKIAYNKLCKYLGNRLCDGIVTEAKHGEFLELRDTILDWCGKHDFTFFFIDPTGWKDVVEIETLRPLLKRNNSEYLINFMFDFIRRSIPQNTFERQMREIFGEIPDTNNMTPDEKEDYLLKLYIRRLKETQSASGLKPRAAKVQILHPTQNRTKYYLLYLTRHSRGIQVFMKTSEKIGIIQRRVHAQTKQNYRVAKNRQPELFSVETTEFSDDDSDLSAVKEYWLRKLTEEPQRFDLDMLADMLEETGWFESYLQNALKELIKVGIVQNMDTNRLRPKNVVDFTKCERLKRM